MLTGAGRNRGGALTKIAMIPQRMKSQTISDSVQAVATASALKSVQSSQSFPTVAGTNLYALCAMMAITAAPIP